MKKNVAILWVINFLQGMAFYMAMFSSYRQSMGVTVEQIALMEGCHSLLVFLLVIPAGIAADRFGYKKTLLAANGIYFLSKAAFALSTGFFGFLLERLLRAAAVSCLSSVNGAVLFMAGREKKRRAFSGHVAANGLGLAFASVSLPTWLNNDVRLAAIWTAAAFFAAWLLTFFLFDCTPCQKDALNGGKNAMTAMRSRVQELLRELGKRKSMFLFLAAAAMFEQGSYLLSTVYASLFYDTAQIGKEYYGLLFAMMRGMTVMSAAAPLFAGKLGLRRTMAAALLAGAAACAVLFALRSPFAVVGALALYRAAGGVFAPLKMEVQNQAVTGQNRASMLAAFLLVSKGCYALIDWLISLVVSLCKDAMLSVVPLSILVLCAAGFGLFCLWNARAEIGNEL